jgi:hypothetical protein
MKKMLIVTGILLLTPLWAAAGQGLNAGFESDDLTLYHEQGTLFQMEWGSQTAIINGYRYHFAPDAKVQINGTFGAWSMLQEGTNVDFLFRLDDDMTRRTIVELYTLPDGFPMEGH